MSNRKAGSNSTDDVEKLIMLVQERPVLYNHNMKDYHNKDIIDKTWEEVAAHMNASPGDCKVKWQTLRNCYARHLREEKKYARFSSGATVNKRKKWYLAEVLGFLADFMGHHRKAASNFCSADESQSDETEMEGSSSLDIHLDDPAKDSECAEMDNSSEWIKPPAEKESKPQVKMSETVAGAVIEFLKARTQPPPQPEDDTNLYFFKSILPDLKRLHPRRQRKFKAATIKKLYELLDEQDEEFESYVSQQQARGYSESLPSPSSASNPVSPSAGMSVGICPEVIIT